MASRARLVGQGVAIGLVALLFILLAWSLLNDEGGGLKSAAAKGDLPQAPELTLERLDETGELQLSSLRGKAVVLNVWASWCIPCQQEAPVIQKVWPEYHDRGYTFIGIDLWEAESDARRFIEQHRLDFPLAPDTERKVYVDYGVAALPAAFFLEPGLRAKTRYQGPLDEATLRVLLDELQPPRGVTGGSR